MSFGIPDPIPARQVIYEDSNVQATLDLLSTEADVAAAILSQLRGFTGPVALTTSYQSPLNRWSPVADRRDTLQATIGGAICRVWMEVKNLDPAFEYSLELRALVRDFSGSAVSARAYRLPVGTQVSLPIEVAFGSSVTTLGLGQVEEVTIQSALLGTQTPCRFLLELVAGNSNANAAPYQFYQLSPVLTEVGPIP